MIRITNLIIFYILFLGSSCTTEPKKDKWIKKHVPADQFYLQRSGPGGNLSFEAYEKALTAAQKQIREQSIRSSSENWEVEGPGNIGGRINTIAVDPTNPNKIFVGSAVGGIHLTLDAGNSWTPVFDDQLFLSISDIEIDPNNSNIVYAGTGDVNITGFPFIGNGIYKSTNGGMTWQHKGLTEGRIISKIKVDPSNSNVIYAAAMGLPFVRNTDRGLYKSVNGGNSWTKVLFLSDSTGVVDLIMDPQNPDTLYCSGWDRIRNNTESLIRGKGNRIYRSYNAGANWTDVSPPQFPTVMSRCGLDIDPAGNIIAHGLSEDLNTFGVFYSTDHGNNWTAFDQSALPNIMGGFGWYFGKIRINPFRTDEIYELGVDLYKTKDAGTSWNIAAPGWWTYDVHADKHDLVFIDSSTMLLATDGGLYKSTDNASTWTDIENIPNTQFYRVAVNPYAKRDYWGGAQDNGTTHGNKNNPNNWPRIFGGDGFKVAFHPIDSHVVYCETQNGNVVVSLDGGQQFQSASIGLGSSSAERRNWDMPYVISQHNPSVMYAGTYRVHKSNNNTTNVSFNPISPDLSDGLILNSRFHTITTLDESAIDSNLLFAGTVDANVWVSKNGGSNWQKIDQGIPEYYVTDIKSSKVNVNRLFVSISGYKDNVNIPHIHVSDNLGKTWKSISATMPNLGVNHIEVTYFNDDILFAATDGGVYYTKNQGEKWSRLGKNMPVIPIYDIDIDYRLRRLVAGTHARSIMSISIDTILPDSSEIISKVSGDTILCEGEDVNLTASGGQNYRWLDASLNPIGYHPRFKDSPGNKATYYAEISNRFGATDTIKVNVKYVKKPNLPLQLVKDSIFFSGQFTRVEWYVNSNILLQQHGNYIITDQKGTYHADIFLGSCKFTTDPVNLNEDLNVDPIQLFPNPASDKIFIRSVLTFDKISIYNLNGRLVDDITSESVELEIDDLSSGTYFLHFRIDDQVFVHKFLKLH